MTSAADLEVEFILKWFLFQLKNLKNRTVNLIILKDEVFHTCTVMQHEPEARRFGKQLECNFRPSLE